MAVIRMGKPLYWAMAAGTAIAWGCALVRLRPSRSAGSGISRWAAEGVSRILSVLLLILLISVMTSTWFASGTIQGLIYYGLSVVGPGQVLVAGFVLASLVSLVLGSSVGTVTTVGIAVAGIARALGMPLAPVAGAVVSGAIFGDRVSLLSPILHLMVDMTGAKQDRVLKRVVQTGAVAWAVSLAAYVAVGAATTAGAGGTLGLAWRAGYLDALRTAVRINPLVILPPALVVALAARKVPVRMCLLLGLVAGAALALLYQGTSPLSLVRYAFLGFRSDEYPPALAGVLQSGGLAGTLNMGLMMLFAGTYTGIMESSGMMGDISSGLVDSLRSPASVLGGAMALSAVSSVLASNQALAVVIPARVLKDRAREVGVRPEALAGALADSGVALAGIIPWNLMAAITAQALQCPVVAYAPYAFLVLAQPVVGAALITIESFARQIPRVTERGH